MDGHARKRFGIEICESSIEAGTSKMRLKLPCLQISLDQLMYLEAFASRIFSLKTARINIAFLR